MGRISKDEMETGEEANFNAVLGARISDLRRAARFSQAELAAAMADRGTPMTQQSWTRVERGLRPLKFREALTLAEVLEVDVESLASTGASAQKKYSEQVALTVIRQVLEGMQHG
jgi:transcriptional regulator with XRE-family HTH domain